MQAPIAAPRLDLLLAPLLASLPAAAVSPQPPEALIPLLSPILRQRVQLLSGSEFEPWLPNLCYNASQTSKLENIAKSGRLEAHPVSGEVEVDWEYDVDVRYKRVDQETLQALVVFPELGLTTKLVWCVNDEVGGGDGWRIGDVGVWEKYAASSWGSASLAAAESAFASFSSPALLSPPGSKTNGSSVNTSEEDEEDDGDYWAQYDQTPGTTPAPNRSPAVPAAAVADEDSYYAQYATVQPAMDNHDPDEHAQNGDVQSSLGRDEIAREMHSNFTSNSELHGTSNVWSENSPHTNGFGGNGEGSLEHPRPSSRSSESTVDNLEKKAKLLDQSELGIKQHISKSIKNLYQLAKNTGIEWAEFDRLVRRELEVLPLMDEDLEAFGIEKHV